MTDLVIFIAIVGLVVVVGVLVGMIVAGRIDRILAPKPAPPAGDGDHGSTSTAAQEDRP